MNRAENRLDAARHLAGAQARTAYFAVLQRLMQRSVGQDASVAASGVPMPREVTLLRDVLALNSRDAANIAKGIYPAPVTGGSLAAHVRRVSAMFDDLPEATQRRLDKRGDEAATLPEAAGLPTYYTQNFHYQSGGYLTADSAELYDLQVETLFLGCAAAMRRQTLPYIANFIRGRDQRRLSLVDVACGTGVYLEQLAQAFPALPMTGYDLSAAYIAAGQAALSERRNVTLAVANAEALPRPDNSADVVTCVFLFHELPREVRRIVLREIHRVLKPGGLFVFADSAQTGDEPRYDGLLASFPTRFHEPYYDDYLADDVAAALTAAGFVMTATSRAFLTKIVAASKA